MKATLHLSAHHVLADNNIVEVRFNGALLCTIAGADGPGIRIISKHIEPARGPVPGICQLMFHVGVQN